MKVAVVSDIHGNLPALEAVLADIARRGVDGILNCGDLCTAPLWPRETFERLEALKLPTVRGNHDRWIADLPSDKMSPALQFTRAELSADQRARLGALPLTERIGDDLLMCHGTPTDDYEYLLEDGVDDRLALARPDQIARRIEGVAAAVIVCGHSHNAAMTLAPGGQLIVNPGSVGCPQFADNPTAPRQHCRSPHARYAIIARDHAGRWSADFHGLAYDWDAAAARAQSLGFPAWARAYRTGNV